MDIGLSGDLLMDVGLSSNLLINVGLSRDLLMDVRLSSRVEVSIGNRGIIGSGIDSTDGGSWKSSWETSITSSGIGITSSGGIWVASIANSTGIASRESVLGTGNSQAGKGGNKGLHSDF